jgi:hypothetical protein
MRKLMLAAPLAGLFLLAGCVTLQDVITAVVTSAKNICGVVVNASDLEVALAGENVDALSKTVNVIAHSICDQYTAQVTVSKLRGELKPVDAAGTCVNVNVGGHPVRTCK